jgi:hypothetical protein
MGQPLADCDFNLAALHPAYPIKRRTSAERTQASPERRHPEESPALDPLENNIRRLRPVGVEDFLCRNLRHDHPRHFWIKPANTVGAHDKIGWIENVSLDEFQRLTIDLRPLRLH